MASTDELEGYELLAEGVHKKILKAGAVDGKRPVTGDQVVAHYTGRLLDGTVFDSSVTRGTPFKVRLFWLLAARLAGSSNRGVPATWPVVRRARRFPHPVGCLRCTPRFAGSP